MDSKKPLSNKIREIVRLQQILKKWKKLANKPTTNTSSSKSNINKFLKKTLSFSESSSSDDVVPKGFLAVCVGRELKRFIIPTQYLGHQAFGILLREAEEEFGFQNDGVLKIPCDVAVFERILKMMEENREVPFYLHDDDDDGEDMIGCCCCSPDSDHLLTPSRHPQMCR